MVQPPPFLADMELHASNSLGSELTTLMYRACQLRYTFAQLGPQQEAAPLLSRTDAREKCQGQGQLLREAISLDAALEEWHQRMISRGGWSVPLVVPVAPEKRPQWVRELFGAPGAPKKMIIHSSLLRGPVRRPMPRHAHVAESLHP